jgi:hypothetical protein
MINLDQVQLLEQKVSSALELIGLLREENKKLRVKLDGSQARMAELETLIESFKGEQDAIEKSILSALTKLDKIEDDISVAGSAEKKSAPLPPVATEKPERAAAAKSRAEKKPEAEKREEDDEQMLSGEPGAATRKQDELDIF